jgi:hypothetical protein
MPAAELIHADVLDALAGMPAESFDAVLCDPPYGLSDHGDIAPMLTAWLAGEPYRHRKPGFMGRSWDAMVPGPECWREVLRVLRPGGHALVFAGTRSQDLMGVSLRLAGFEIRDCIDWLYGTGFPKSVDVSQALDKAAGAKREVVAEGKAVRRLRPGADQERDGTWEKLADRTYTPAVTLPATPEAETWDGYGTGLKPAHEPVLVVRKPLDGTVVENCLRHGTGALNIDGSRIETTDALGGGAEVRTTPEQKGNEGWVRPWMTDEASRAAHAVRVRANVAKAETLGRWPANVIHDGSAEVLAGFPAEAGARAPVTRRGSEKFKNAYGTFSGQEEAGATFHDDAGSAARFFYCAKASGADRWFLCRICGTPHPEAVRAEHRHNTSDWDHIVSHPTVKPTALDAYLAGLLLPPVGIGRPLRILVPFSGSGSELVGALRAGWDEAVGVDQDADYIAIARARTASELADIAARERARQASERARQQERAQHDLFAPEAAE